MKVIHLISGGDTGGAKTHVLSLLQKLNEQITAQLICFREGEFAQEARGPGHPHGDLRRATTCPGPTALCAPSSAPADTT